MHLNHIDLHVTDVDLARQFFETYFDLRCKYQRQKQIAFFEGEIEFAVSNLFGKPPSQYPSDFHVGFVVDSAAEVRRLYEKLKAGGVKFKLELGIQGPNLVFQCIGPDGIPVEARAPKDS